MSGTAAAPWRSRPPGPYRPVDGESPGRTETGRIEAPDAWLDPKGRIWHTDRPESLPKDPVAVDRLPPQFWHPASRRAWEDAQHRERKWEQDAMRRDLSLI